MAGSHQSQPGNYPNGSGSLKPQERAYWLAVAPRLQNYDFFYPFAAFENRMMIRYAQPLLQGKYSGTSRLGSAPAFPLISSVTLRNSPP